MKKEYESPEITVSVGGEDCSPQGGLLWLGALVYGVVGVAWFLYLVVHNEVLVSK
ncbi:MAG: hypothetical protein Q4A52_05320 [Bacillota bacterium]|nr:hypothetical protein [Bacillota bacterium]